MFLRKATVGGTDGGSEKVGESLERDAGGEKDYDDGGEKDG